MVVVVTNIGLFGWTLSFADRGRPVGLPGVWNGGGDGDPGVIRETGGQSVAATIV